jgi:hypothetical protein
VQVSRKSNIIVTRAQDNLEFFLEIGAALRHVAIQTICNVMIQHRKRAFSDSLKALGFRASRFGRAELSNSAKS